MALLLISERALTAQADQAEDSPFEWGAEIPSPLLLMKSGREASGRSAARTTSACLVIKRSPLTCPMMVNRPLVSSPQAAQHLPSWMSNPSEVIV